MYARTRTTMTMRRTMRTIERMPNAPKINVTGSIPTMAVSFFLTSTRRMSMTAANITSPAMEALPSRNPSAMIDCRSVMDNMSHHPQSINTYPKTPAMPTMARSMNDGDCMRVDSSVSPINAPK